MSDVDVLFVHNNFPAQFRNLARMFVAKGLRVAAIASKGAPGMPGVTMQRYTFPAPKLDHVHPFARRFEIESRRAEQVIYAANLLKLDGFRPRLIYVHPGWGEALPLRPLFPDATICAYAEFYYAPSGIDVGFDREFPSFGVDGETRVVLRNAATLLSLADADFAVAPTFWQRSVFPREFRPKIRVAHDGLDTDRLAPREPQREIEVAGRRFGPEDEIVTFVSRNLEPYRGFHIFMRALPAILKARPRAQICIMGGDEVSYGAPPLDHPNWRTAMLTEVGAHLDPARVHFLGALPYEEYQTLVARSAAHVYLTYPFVLSWSMLEAMSMGALVIGSDTPPVAEVLQHGENGILVPFFDVEALSARIIEALANPARFQPIRRAARATIVENFDFERRCWADHVQIIRDSGCSERVIERL